MHAVLAQLLQALQSPDNNVRTQAENQLNSDWVAGREDVLLMGLVEQIQGSQDVAVELLSCSWVYTRLTAFRHDLLRRSCFGEWLPKRAKILQRMTSLKSSYLSVRIRRML